MLQWVFEFCFRQEPCHELVRWSWQAALHSVLCALIIWAWLKVLFLSVFLCYKTNNVAHGCTLSCSHVFMQGITCCIWLILLQYLEYVGGRRNLLPVSCMKGLRWSLNNCFSRDFPLQIDPITLDIPGVEPYSKLFWLWIEWSQWWKLSLIKELHKLLHAGVTLTHNKLQSALPFQAILIR